MKYYDEEYGVYFKYFVNQIEEYQKLELEPELILENLLADDMMVKACLSMPVSDFSFMLCLLRYRIFKYDYIKDIVEQ